MREHLFKTIVVVHILLVPAVSRASYGIVATDPTTHELGVAIGSCEAPFPIRTYTLVAGHGEVIATGMDNPAARDQAMQLLQSGMAPDAILNMLTTPGYDSLYPIRQYAIADVDGRVAGYSGMSLKSYAEHRQGTAGAIHYVVAVNQAASPTLPVRAATAFESYGCDMADRLMLALEAASPIGDGDTRCSEGLRGDAGTGPTIPANTALLEVNPAGSQPGSYLHLSISNIDRKVNAIVTLRQQYNDWRQSHPCPDGQNPGALPDGGSPADGAAGANTAGGGSCQVAQRGGEGMLIGLVAVGLVVALASWRARPRRRS
jgi:hypothetical protein